MYGEYPEIYEPTEFEITINDLIRAEVNHKKEQLVVDLKYYKEKYEESQNLLRKANSKIWMLENEHEKKIEKALKEKELEVKRGFGFGLTINDVVYYIKENCSKLSCKLCDGKGKVKVNVFNKITNADCPYCHYGNIWHYTYFPKKDFVKSIKITINNLGLLFNEIYLKDNTDHYFTDLKDLYKTLEECQTICDEKNKIEEEKRKNYEQQTYNPSSQ